MDFNKLHIKPRKTNGNSIQISLDLQGTIVIAEGPVIHLLGYHTGYLPGKKFQDLIFDEDADKLAAVFDRQTDRVKFRMYRADGSPMFADAFIYDLYDEINELKGVRLKIYDVTSSMEQVNTLIENEEKYLAIVENARDVIFIFRDRKILYINDVAVEILGYRKEQLLRMDYINLFPEPDRSRIEEYSQKLDTEASERCSCVAALLTAKGEKLICDFDVKKIRYGGSFAYMAIIHDITEFQQNLDKLTDLNREAEAASRIKSDFLAVLSHEIRTSLNGVLGMSNLLLNTELNALQQDYAENIRLSGENMVEIINDVLDFARMDSGKLEITNEPFSLQTSIEEVIDVLAFRAVEKELDLIYFIDKDVPENIISDALRLRQVLLNLTSNAIKFTESGEIFISVKLLDRHDDSATLRFQVKDTGIGIESKRLPHLFEPFVQAGNATSRKYGGTGLGLAISQRLIRMMGGEIWAESEPGKGSAFFFNIKVMVPVTEEAEPKGGEEVAELKDRRVLIVDDNETNCSIIKKYIEGWGMTGITAGSGNEALELLDREGPFHLAVLDYHMPGMNGIQLARKIRIRGRYENLPVILLSSMDEGMEYPTDLVSARLIKPVKSKSLFNEVLQIMTDVQKKAKQTKIHENQIDTDLSKRLPLQILVAEDNPVNQKLAISLLNLMGYKPDAAANGLEVLRMMENKEYDMILMDLQMPEMSGMDAAQRIFEDYPPEKRPCIIAITANALLGDKEKCFEIGMVDYMAKPIRIHELQNVIEKWGTLRFEKRNCPGGKAEA